MTAGTMEQGRWNREEHLNFAFHAAPPPGEWINDPNGLVFADGRYRLFMQHSAVGPDYKDIGWARMSSDDLLHWEWDGQVIPPDASGLAYSGSIAGKGGRLTATLTRHAPPIQKQYRLTSDDAGASWLQGDAALGPEGRNVRDPFMFDCAATGDRRMLLAEPCDWSDWRTDPASCVSVWGEGVSGYGRVGTIGPWSPRGVMWEVPVLLDFGARQVLIVSTVDRREDVARCSVRYWVGRFDGSSFAPETSAEGVLLDAGPDFYATCVNTVDGWPDSDRVMVGWASSWATAREVAWPGGVHGGPISLPRTLTLIGGRLHQQPAVAALNEARRAYWAPGQTLELVFDEADVKFALRLAADGALDARRTGANEALTWEWGDAQFLDAPTDILVFADCGLIEIFFAVQGKTMTVFVPGATLQKGKFA